MRGDRYMVSIIGISIIGVALAGRTTIVTGAGSGMAADSTQHNALLKV